MAETGASAGSEQRTVFVNSSMGTHMVMSVSDVDTVGDFKRKVAVEHSHCFPDKGNIEIHAIKVKRKSMFYHLSNSMLVKSAFSGFSGTWFLYMDATSTSLTNQEESLEDHLKQPSHRPESSELEPRNYDSSLNPATAQYLLQPADSTMNYLGNSSLLNHVPLKESVDKVQIMHSSNQFDAEEIGEPSNVLENTSHKSDHDTEMQEPAAPSEKDINNKNLGVDALEMRGDLAVSLKKSKRSRNVQAGDASSEILLEEPSKKKQKEMEKEVAYSDFPKDHVEECDTRDEEAFRSSGEALKALTDNERAVSVSELVSGHLNDDHTVAPSLIDSKKKKKKKKHVKLQSGVVLSEVTNTQNVAPTEEIPSGPDKQNAASALELESEPNLFNYESSSVAKTDQFVQDVLPDKIKDGVLGGKVESQGHDTFETADKQSKKRKKHRNATDKSAGSHLIGETNKEATSNKNDSKIFDPQEANDVGNESLIPKDKQLDLNEVHKNGQDGNHLNDSRVAIETIAEVLADLSAGRNEDANLGIEVDNKGNSSLEAKEKNSKKSKKHRATSEKHAAPQLVEDVNEENFGPNLITGSLNISNHEGGDSINDANASKEKVLDMNEAEMDNCNQIDTKRSPEAPVVIEDGDLRGKRKTKIKAKKPRHAGVGKQDVSGEGDDNDKLEDRVFDTDPHCNAVKAVNNGLSFIENSKASKSDKLTNSDTHKVSDSEVKSTNLNSIIEDNLLPENEKGKRKSKRSRASHDKAYSEKSDENHTIHQTDGEKEEKPLSTNAKKSKSRKVTLQTHLSEPALEKDNVLEKQGSAGNHMEEPKKRKKSRSEKAKLKTHSLESYLEKDMGIRADTSLTNSEPRNDLIDSPKGPNHESQEPREDFQAKGAHAEKEHQNKSDESGKNLSGYPERTVAVLESANKSNHVNEKRTSVIAHENIGASSKAEHTALTVNNTLPKDTSVEPAESSDNNVEGINGTIYTNGKGKRALSRSDRYRVAVRKPLDKKLGEVLNASDQKKGSVTNDESIFHQNASESSEDGGEANYSDATTQNVSDDSYASDFSGGGDETPTSANGADTKSPKNGISKDSRNKETSGDEIVLSQSTATKKPLDAILRSSRRYKKAKVTASQTLLEDEESQRFEPAPDSQPDHDSPVTLSKP
ncbi:hypothetical protein H6P81_012468 [Aristolochia fimbriata]|uniref:Uncharacterized protein n=1 Tax=Aristolochia fimbriata TaxID=158543 RepID=A0AAV7EBV6_ARIFI|nr:hypothetical protein H6P81_012468 [Aristolochia fimbriata]